MRAIGTGSVFQRASTGRWVAQVQVTDPVTGKKRYLTKVERSRAAAERALVLLHRRALEEGTRPGQRYTVEQWLRIWLEAHRPHVKPRSWEVYSSHVNRHLVPIIGSRRLDLLAARDIRALHRALADRGLARATIAAVQGVLSAALAAAMREEVISKNIAALIPAPPIYSAPRATLTPAQLLQALQALRDDPPHLARRLFAALTGARQGEVLGLHVADVQLYYDAVGAIVGGSALLQWTLQRLAWRHGCGRTCGHRRGTDCPQRTAPPVRGADYRHVTGGLWLGRPKTSTSLRAVPLAPILAQALVPLLADRAPGEFVFARPDGRPIDPERDLDQWRAHLAALGLPPVDLHSLRHSWNSLALEAGVDERMRVAISGHAGAAINRRYSHVSDSAALAAVSTVADHLGITPR